MQNTITLICLYVVPVRAASHSRSCTQASKTVSIVRALT